MANVHPWFANVSIDQAAMWTNMFFEQNDVVLSTQVPNHPQMYIAETGWPSVIQSSFKKKKSIERLIRFV
jgi:exo-beta-1,3-glucanase (GH17 family)